MDEHRWRHGVDADLDLLDLVGDEPVLGAQIEQGIDGRVRGGGGARDGFGEAGLTVCL